MRPPRMERLLASLPDVLVLRACSLIERYDRRGRQRTSGARQEDLQEGQLVQGRYALKQVLGQGGMGRVWLAEDTLEKRPVALKEMRISGASGSASVGASSDAGAQLSSSGQVNGADVAFKREFYTMTKLQHPNTVKVYDYGMLSRQTRFITMEVVRGSDLSELVRRGTVDLKKVYRVLIDLANVLGFIHSRLYVHCDVKSDNIRLTDAGAVKLMDFGLMHQLGTPTGGTLKGTLAYMAPEIPKGGIIDARTDLYALGVLAFELATGRYPFLGKTPLEIIRQHLEKAPPRLKPLRDVPDAFESLVTRLLAKDPRERPADTSELLRELGALTGKSVTVQDYGASTSYLHSAELVGRAAEQEVLQKALAKLREGAARSLFVTAPAGVGKTRLLQEFRLAAKIADVTVVTGQCRAEGQAPLAPLVDALDQLLPLAPAATLAAHGPMLSRIVPRVLDRGVTAAPPGDAAAEKPKIFAALRGFLRETATAHPFILCMEDLHWAESTTLEFLNIAIRELDHTHGMVLGTLRSNEVDPFSPALRSVRDGVTDRLELSLFSVEHTAALLKSMLRNTELLGEFVEHLQKTTQGNAFFVTETLRTLIEQQVIKMEGGRWVCSTAAANIELPSSIESAVALRLRSLSPQTLELCRKLAPMGRTLDLRLVKRVSGLPDDALFAVLDELVERQFLQRVMQDFYFSHDTVRQGIYRDTDAASRKTAHQQIAVALESLHSEELEAQASVIGYHYARGSDVDKAVHYLLLAGNRALRANLLVEALRLLGEGADLLEQQAGPENRALLETWSKLVEAGALGAPAVCVKYAEKLCPLLEQRMGGEQGVRFFSAESERMRQRPGYFGRNKLVKMWSEQPFDATSSDPLHLVPKVASYRNALAFSYGALGQGPKAAELLTRLMQENPDRGPLRATAQISKAVGLYHMGQWDALRKEALEANQMFAEHLASVGALPRRLMWNYASTFYWYSNATATSGRRPDAALYKTGLEICAEHRFGDWAFFLKLSQYIYSCLIGLPEENEQTYGPVNDTVRQLGTPPLMDRSLNLFRPVYYLQRLEDDLAAAAIDKLDALAQLLNDTWMKRYVAAYRAQLLAQSGSPKAQPALDAALAAAREVPSFSRLTALLCTQAQLLARADKTAAIKLAQEALARASQGPAQSPWDECVALRVLAEVQQGPEGLATAHAAVEAARKHAHPLQEGLSLLTVATLCVAKDRALAASSTDQAEQVLGRFQSKQLLAKVQAFRQQASRG